MKEKSTIKTLNNLRDSQTGKMIEVRVRESERKEFEAAGEAGRRGAERAKRLYRM